jgi:hypothetical protein
VNSQVKAARPAHFTAPLAINFSSSAVFRQAWRSRWLRLALGVSFSSLLLGCAAEGPPQPPRLERPQPIHDLKVHQIGRTFEILLTLPTLASDGQRLTKPIEVDLFRAITPPNRRPQAPATSGKPWVSLSRADLARYARGPRLAYPFTLSRAEFLRHMGSSFTFLAVSLTRGFRHRPFASLPSNLAVAPILDVTEHVQNLAVKTTSKALVLKWGPPQQTLSGGLVPSRLTYRIYASSSGKPGSFHLLASIASDQFEDRDFRFGKHYYFVVRTITTNDHVIAESDNSNLAEITPTNIFPPAAPRNLSGLYAAGSIELVWQVSTKSNLAGYRVYRREDHRPFVLMNKALLLTPVFHDATVRLNHRYIYAVTAVDQSGNESAKSHPVAIEAR